MTEALQPLWQERCAYPALQTPNPLTLVGNDKVWNTVRAKNITGATPLAGMLRLSCPTNQYP